jgi:hypothetical protein
MVNPTQAPPYQVYSKSALSNTQSNNITGATKFGGKKLKQYGGYPVQANNTPSTIKSNSVNDSTTVSNNSQQTYVQGVANATNDAGANGWNTKPTVTSGGGRRKSRRTKKSRKTRRTKKSRKHKRRNTYKK